MIIKVLAKKHARDVLKLISRKPMYFSEIQKSLKIHPKILTSILNELIDIGLVEKWEVDTGQKLPKTYYGITPKGKSALLIYKLEDIIDKLKKESSIDEFKLYIDGKSITINTKTSAGT